MIRLLHKLGADVNTASISGFTPIFAAVQEGHCDVIRLLHELGANVNAATSNGSTSVYVAAIKGSLWCGSVTS